MNLAFIEENSIVVLMLSSKYIINDDFILKDVRKHFLVVSEYVSLSSSFHSLFFIIAGKKLILRKLCHNFLT